MKSPSRFASLGLAVLAFASFASAQPHYTRIETPTNAAGSLFPAYLPLTLTADGTLFGVGYQGLIKTKIDGTGSDNVNTYSLLSGNQQVSSLKAGPNGLLYGATIADLFSVNPDLSGTTVIAPIAGLFGSQIRAFTIANDGRIYGLAWGGSGPTVLFRSNLDGTGVTVLHLFAETGPNDFLAPNSLIQGADGRLYGTTSGPSNYDPLIGNTFGGGVFAVNLDGTGFTMLHVFARAEGMFPSGGDLTSGPDGSLYGTTSNGGAFDVGTIFKITPAGIVTVLHTFDPDTEGYRDEGLGLALATDGRLYGTINSGAGERFLYSLRPDGSDFQISFNLSTVIQSYDGPISTLTAGPGGMLYGHTMAAAFSLDISGRPFVQVNIGNFIGPIPEVTTGQVGQPFAYQITATNNPTGYTASGLPAGLTLNSVTGVISGTPLHSGVSSDIYFTATNAVGTSELTPYLESTSPFTYPSGPGSAVRFVINPPDVLLSATVTLGGLTATFDGTAKPASVTTSPAGLNIVVTYNGEPDLPVAAGSYAVVATIDDPDYTGSASGTLTISANQPDSQAPVITGLSTNAPTLWPANHKMVAVTVTATATDNVGVTSLKIIAVTSSEPDNGLGDGDTANDISLTGPLTVALRAERSGKGNGRTYTITVEAKDAAGNKTTKNVTVFVPKNQSGK